MGRSLYLPQRYREAMAILVDAARWPWRETLWCHLVSDRSLDELHEFAADLGCRRVAFQGDHYDIDVATRTVAIERGAHACDSRELVRRIRDAGLRARPSTFEKWGLARRGDVWTDETLNELAALDLATVQTVIAALTTYPDVVRAANQCSGWFVLKREHAAALIFYGTAPGVVGSDGLMPVGDDNSRGVFVRLEQAGPPSWSIEIISPSPDPRS